MTMRDHETRLRIVENNLLSRQSASAQNAKIASVSRGFVITVVALANAITSAILAILNLH